MAKKIKHVHGNLLRIAIPLDIIDVSVANGNVTQTQEHFYPNTAYPVVIVLKKGGTRYPFTATVSDYVVSFEDPGTLPVGVYEVEVLCRNAQSQPMRYMVRSIIEVVDATIDAGIEDGVEFNAESYSLEGGVFLEARGTGIANISVEESQESGGYNVVTVTMTDGTEYTFNVRNGVDGNAVLRHELIEADDFEAAREAGTLSENTIYLIPEEE